MIPGPSDSVVPTGVPGLSAPAPGELGTPGTSGAGAEGAPAGGCTLPAVMPRSKYSEKNSNLKTVMPN